MKDSNDILQKEHLKATPYSMPEGYLESLSEKMLSMVSEESDAVKTRIWAPYLAYAATLVIMLLVGSLILKVSTPQQDDVDYLYYSEFLGLNTETDAIFYTQHIEEDEMSSEDIIDYLIFNQTSSIIIDEQTH